jgi:hypothetical protein
VGASPVKKEIRLENILSKEFDSNRVSKILRHFVDCEQGFESGNWELCLTKAGKFIEAIVKMLWIYCGKPLPPSRDFKAGQYAQKITNEINKATVPHDEIRLQIPRGCIFLYDITSNRGARHDAEEMDPNEMDASLAMTICSWILAELIRFSAKGKLSTEQSKSLVDSITRRRYPTFEEIDDRIYVDSSKYQTPLECAILILYALYPRRIDEITLGDLVTRHGFLRQEFRGDKLLQYIDINEDDKVLLRATGRQKAEEILSRRSG